MNDSWETRFEKKPRRTALNIGLSIIAIVTVLGVTGTVINILIQPARVTQKTFDAGNMIANYEWFHQQHEDVKAFNIRLTAAVAAQTAFETSAGPRDTWKFDDRQEWNRLNTIVLGLTGQRAAMVADYNARTQMANRDIFRSGDLPESLQ